METDQFIKKILLLYRGVVGILILILGMVLSIIYLAMNPLPDFLTGTNRNLEILEGNFIDEEILEPGEGVEIVKIHCTRCHSARLIAQNRATLEGWKGMIIWMQETQNLWDLGDNEDIILEYLAKNYAPVKKGRRTNLDEIDWYELKAQP